MTGQVPWDVEQNILDLRQAIDQLRAEHDQTKANLAALPPILSMEEIQSALGPTGTNPLPTAGLVNTVPPPTQPSSPPPQDDGIPNYLSIVQADAAAAGIGPTSTDEAMFRCIQQIAADINASGMNPTGIVCGFTTAPPAGSNVFTCAGITYRYNRVSFSNGHIYKVFEDSDPGGARTPSWDNNGSDLSLYSPATAPGSPC